MVDFDLLETHALARQAMTLLAESGVLDEMKKRLLERLAVGDPSEKDETMLISIREYRMDLAFVNSLIDVGERIKRKENENEPR